MTTQKRQFGLALVLLTASMLALYPTMTLEKPQQGSALVSIKADGQAFPNSKGKPSSTFSSTTLTLYGSVQMKGEGELKLDDLAGSLQIGLANYAITDGKGEVNKKGKIEINAKTSDADKKLELVLHGNTQGDTVVFNSKESKLSSLYFLSLKGQAIVTMPTTSTSTTESDGDDENENTAVTVTQYNTITDTVTQTLDNTVTVTQNNTVTETATQTVTQPGTNSTVTVTETATATIANSTITVTATIANTTITVTTTVANTTLTTTVANTTLTVPPI